MISRRSPAAEKVRPGDGEPVEDESAKEPEPIEDESATEPAPPRRPTGWLAGMLGLALVMVIALVAGGILLRSVLDYREDTARRDAILSVARDVGQLSYSLDYETFPEQVSKIVAATTGNYRQGLIDSTDGLQYILTQGKVKSSCTITAAGIERDDENTATVLLSITTQVTNAETQVPQVRHYRVAIGLIRQGSQWLVQSNDVIA